MNRLTRDEILHRALNFADLPTLDIKDRPGGNFHDNSFCILWLQEALDKFHNKYPFSGDLKQTVLLLQAGQDDALVLSDQTKFLPTDFIIDVEDGLLVTVGSRQLRIRQRAFNVWLNYATQYITNTSNYPFCYTIVQDRLKYAPRVQQTITAAFWYFAMPGILSAVNVPSFPDGWVLVEYIRLRALEWARSSDTPPGTAIGYIEKQISALRQTGLLNEPENEKIPLGNYAYTDNNRDDLFSWLGAY